VCVHGWLSWNSTGPVSSQHHRNILARKRVPWNISFTVVRATQRCSRRQRRRSRTTVSARSRDGTRTTRRPWRCRCDDPAAPRWTELQPRPTCTPCTHRSSLHDTSHTAAGYLPSRRQSSACLLRHCAARRALKCRYTTLRYTWQYCFRCRLIIVTSGQRILTKSRIAEGSKFFLRENLLWHANSSGGGQPIRMLLDSVRVNSYSERCWLAGREDPKVTLSKVPLLCSLFTPNAPNDERLTLKLNHMSLLPNGIEISSAVFARFMVVTNRHRQTDRQADTTSVAISRI